MSIAVKGHFQGRSRSIPMVLVIVARIENSSTSGGRYCCTLQPEYVFLSPARIETTSHMLSNKNVINF